MQTEVIPPPPPRLPFLLTGLSGVCEVANAEPVELPPLGRLATTAATSARGCPPAPSPIPIVSSPFGRAPSDARVSFCNRLHSPHSFPFSPLTNLLEFVHFDHERSVVESLSVEHGHSLHGLNRVGELDDTGALKRQTLTWMKYSSSVLYYS